MEVTKEWLETTGTKISAEDIRQMQLLYEQPEETLGSVVGRRSLYLSAEGSLYQCVEYDDEQRTNERYRQGSSLRSIRTRWRGSGQGKGILRTTGPASQESRRRPYGHTGGILKRSGPCTGKRKGRRTIRS